MDENASARNVYAREVRLGPNCRVSGDLVYTEKFESSEGVRLGSEPKKAEKLPQSPI
jgi:hypothetical protein